MSKDEKDDSELGSHADRYESLKKSAEKKYGTKIFMILSTDKSDADWIKQKKKSNSDSQKE